MGCRQLLENTFITSCTVIRLTFRCITVDTIQCMYLSILDPWDLLGPIGSTDEVRGIVMDMVLAILSHVASHPVRGMGRYLDTVSAMGTITILDMHRCGLDC